MSALTREPCTRLPWNFQERCGALWGIPLLILSPIGTTRWPPGGHLWKKFAPQISMPQFVSGDFQQKKIFCHYKNFFEKLWKFSGCSISDRQRGKVVALYLLPTNPCERSNSRTLYPIALKFSGKMRGTLRNPPIDFEPDRNNKMAARRPSLKKICTPNFDATICFRWFPAEKNFLSL